MRGRRRGSPGVRALKRMFGGPEKGSLHRAVAWPRRELERAVDRWGGPGMNLRV